jgi:hypothetical protein
MPISEMKKTLSRNAEGGGPKKGEEALRKERRPLFGPNVLPIFFHIFPSTVQVLHVICS